jgi:O-antigen/teichoic acid export membrane protein
MQAKLAPLARRAYQKETKETLWSFASKGSAAVLFFALTAYLARKMGVELYGRWSFLLSNLTILFALSYFGLNNAARAFAARHNGTPELRAVLRGSLRLRVALSLGFVLLYLLLRQPLAAALRLPELAELALPGALLILAAGLVEYEKQVFTGLHRIKYHFIITSIELTARLVLAVLLLNISLTLASALHAYWLGVAGAALIGGYFLWQYYRRAPDQPAAITDAHLRGRLLRYSLPLFVISFGFLAQTEIDTLMLGLLSSDAQVGYFSAGKQLANKLPQIAFAISMGTMQLFARMDAGNRETMQRKLGLILKINAAIFLPLGGALILLSPWIIPLLFGPAYAASVPPLQILAVWIVMSAFNIYLNNFLDYQGRANRRAVNFTLTIVATIGLNYWLIPLYGAVGAAVATTVSYVPYVIFNALEVRSVFREMTMG